MALSQINTGSAANDGTGDTLRAAFGKTNAGLTQADVNTAAIAAHQALIDGKPIATVRAASTTNISLSGAQTSDGVTLANNDLFLAKNQSTSSQNGVYVVNTAGAWTRAVPASSFAQLPGMLVTVQEGTTLASTLWQCTSPKGGTLGSTPLTFTQQLAGGGGGGGSLPTQAGHAGQALVTDGSNPSWAALTGLTNPLTGDIAANGFRVLRARLPIAHKAGLSGAYTLETSDTAGFSGYKLLFDDATPTTVTVPTGDYTGQSVLLVHNNSVATNNLSLASPGVTLNVKSGLTQTKGKGDEIYLECTGNNTWDVIGAPNGSVYLSDIVAPSSVDGDLPFFDATQGAAGGYNRLPLPGTDNYVLTARPNAGAAGHKVVWAAPGGGGSGADANAVHVNASGEIGALTLKGTPVSGDFLIIEDSAASGAKKKVTVGSLPTATGGTDSNAIHVATAAEISALTGKTTPANADVFVLEDSAASFAKKKITFANLTAGLGGGGGSSPAFTPYVNTTKGGVGNFGRASPHLAVSGGATAPSFDGSIYAVPYIWPGAGQGLSKFSVYVNTGVASGACKWAIWDVDSVTNPGWFGTLLANGNSSPIDCSANAGISKTLSGVTVTQNQNLWLLFQYNSGSIALMAGTTWAPTHAGITSQGFVVQGFAAAGTYSTGIPSTLSGLNALSWGTYSGNPVMAYLG